MQSCSVDVVTFKWNGNRNYTADHVNALYRMVRKHYHSPFRFTVITDDRRGVDSNIRIVKLWDDFAGIESAFGPKHPSCYRRLKLFSPEARELIGERIVCLDLDTVIVGNLLPLWDRPEDVVFYKGQWGSVGTQDSKNPYNGSMFMLTAGSRVHVWRDFDPESTPMAARAAGYGGSDQAWFALALGSGEAIWSKADGVYSYRNDLLDGRLPSDARMVMFHGRRNPWDQDCRRMRWVRDNYGC